MTKKELLLKILKIIIIYSYLSYLCYISLMVFMIGFEGELFTVTQFYLILYGVPLDLFLVLSQKNMPLFILVHHDSFVSFRSAVFVGRTFHYIT